MLRYYDFFKWAEQKIDPRTQPLCNPDRTLNEDYDPWAEYHRRSRTQHLAIEALRYPLRFWRRNAVRRFCSDFAYKHWLRRGLAANRDVYFYGRHVNISDPPEGRGNTWEDVLIGFTGREEDARFAFTATSLADVQFWAEDAWRRGELLQGVGDTLIGEFYLTEENLAQACEHWYKDQVRWRRGHFSHREGPPRIHTSFCFKTYAELSREDPLCYPLNDQDQEHGLGHD